MIRKTSLSRPSCSQTFRFLRSFIKTNLLCSCVKVVCVWYSHTLEPAICSVQNSNHPNVTSNLISYDVLHIHVFLSICLSVYHISGTQIWPLGELMAAFRTILAWSRVGGAGRSGRSGAGGAGRSGRSFQRCSECWGSQQKWTEGGFSLT